MKEQSQNTPDLTNEEEIGSLPEKEFRIMIAKMIQNLGNRIDKMQETFNKDEEELKRNKAMMKNTNLKRYIQPHVHYIIIYNSQGMKTKYHQWMNG